MYFHLKIAPDSTLTEALSTIPEGVTELSLEENDLGKISVEEIVQGLQGLKKISSSIKSLSLGWTELEKKNENELTQLFSALPPTINSLDLRGNHFGDKEGVEWAKAFKAIPTNVNTLYLNYAHLSNKSADELVQIFSSVPPWITSLHLEENDFYKKTGAELEKVFQSCRVNSLHLGRNNLAKIPIDDLVKALKAFPSDLKLLNLENNNFNEISAQLAKVLTAIPPSVISLNLQRNHLYAIKDYELAIAFSSIPKTVISCDLRDNFLHLFTLENLQGFKNSLNSIKTITLDFDIIKSMDLQKREALNEIFPNIENVILIDGFGANSQVIDSSKTVKEANIVRKLHLKTGVPSLKNLTAPVAGFFQTQSKNKEGINIPDELQITINQAGIKTL